LLKKAHSQQKVLQQQSNTSKKFILTTIQPILE